MKKLIETIKTWWENREKKNRAKEYIAKRNRAESLYNIVSRGSGVYITYNGRRCSLNYESIEMCTDAVLKLRELWILENND